MTKEGKVGWRCPSNIALVKYWGKYGRQYPKNPSVSLTLSEAHTDTYVKYTCDQGQKKLQLTFEFEGQKNVSFENKIRTFLTSIVDQYPLIPELSLDIKSQNSFPHSSGIASSASSMAALAMCLVDIEKSISHLGIDYNRASHLARLGSGSASRSVIDGIAVWGDIDIHTGSSNDYAIGIKKDVDQVFWGYRDDILIVSKAEKSVSSRAGHALMETNHFAERRFEQAYTHMREIHQAMIDGDLEKFGHIVEKEALTLHALMMASCPPYILMEPHTITVIRQIQAFRKEEHIPVYFTLDAGPNIHLLYPEGYKDQVSQLIESVLPYCENGQIISDRVGSGPQNLVS